MQKCFRVENVPQFLKLISRGFSAHHDYNIAVSLFFNDFSTVITISFTKSAQKNTNFSLILWNRSECDAKTKLLRHTYAYAAGFTFIVRKLTDDCSTIILLRQNAYGKMRAPTHDWKQSYKINFVLIKLNYSKIHCWCII